jgi:hypothetical protein
MHRLNSPSGLVLVPLALALVSACGGGPIEPDPNEDDPSVICAAVAPLNLAVGEHMVLNPASTSGCLRVPAAGGAGAEYLVVLSSGATVENTSGAYQLRTVSQGGAAAAPPTAPRVAPPQSIAPRSPGAQQRFDGMLRARERGLLADPRNRVAFAPPAAVAAAPPTVGDQRTFKVCTNLTCSTFGDVTATARYVGDHIAVYLDDDVPTNDPLTNADLQELGETFDEFHYPIDTTAFGRESDLDNNQVVIALMTDAVNALTSDCSDGRIIGYFFGGDLLVNFANSNKSEVFYTLVPHPSTSGCTSVSRQSVINNLKPTLIHEFQHMISFNQRALVRTGNSEETWLNEALSHFAEELAGRLIPSSECTPTFPSCRSQYSSGNLLNVYDFMREPEDEFLIFPGNGSLEERGASWIFLRWALDQFAADTILGTATTRQLVQTTALGAANVAAATGGNFQTMVAQYLLALYLDDSGFTEPTGRLRLKSWGLRSIFVDPANQSPQGPFSGFPLVPQVSTGAFTKTGTLRTGTGTHLILRQAASGPGIDVHVRKNAVGDPLDAALQARYGIVRIQ